MLFKKIRIKKWIVLIVAAVMILAIAGVAKIMQGNSASLQGQHLNKYNYTSGGGMAGDYYGETIKREDDHALISIVSAEWFMQDPIVTEYLTDITVLDELESIVRKYRMDSWDGKTFTDEIVYDGGTESYRFYYDDETVFFSSQIYPAKYRKKLKELDLVVKKYIEAGEKLPGLVNPRIDEREEENDSLPENELEIYVYSYAENVLGLRILNGTEEEIEMPDSYKLINMDTDTVLYEEETPYGEIFSANSVDERQIRLEERLVAGNYRLIYGGREITFEIR